MRKLLFCLVLLLPIFIKAQEEKLDSLSFNLKVYPKLTDSLNKSFNYKTGIIYLGEEPEVYPKMRGGIIQWL